MKICIISSQILGFGKIGGFGSMTKKLAESLHKAGHEVVVVVPRKKNQKYIEDLHGITVYGLKLSNLFHFKKIFKEINADIYHSQSPNLFTLLAQLAEKDKKHVITCRDPRNLYDWYVEMKYATWIRRLKTPAVYLAGPLIDYAVRNADIVGCPAHFLIEKVERMYGRKDAILFPNLETFPEKIPVKSKKPAVCFVGRLDKRKRPELVFEVAKQFPEVTFTIIGKAEDTDRQQMLEEQAKKIPNIKMLGYIDKLKSKSISNMYSDSWILINTSAREGLPMTFIEAAGHGCAILSHVNPDNFASDFGYHAETDDFSAGLQNLLEDNTWKKKGEKAFKYVTSLYSEEKALKIHIDVYKKLLK